MLTFVFLKYLAVGVIALNPSQSPDQLRTAESQDYYERWLNQDVLYIITDEERSVFEQLTQPAEKEAFIEQFWRRRDPDPTTEINEFREEHFRRIAYANDHFSEGTPGWKSDRGRMYIIHGPPDSIESHAQGEQYYRPINEGGGQTSTYAWESWYYRHIPGFEEPVEVQFVDKSMSGHYVFARDDLDKDALLWVPGLGLTEGELLLSTNKAERIGTRSMANLASRQGGNPLKVFTQQDDLFARLRRYAHLQAAPAIQFRDLEQLIDLKVEYSQVPFDVSYFALRMTPTDFLVPLTFFFDTQTLTFERLGGLNQATLDLYGRVEGLSGKQVLAFEDTVDLSLSDAKSVRSKHSVFQRSIPLRPGRYKLVTVIKDTQSGRIGTSQTGIWIPEPRDEKLALSEVILADRIQPAGSEQFITDPFVLGTVKVYPNPTASFECGRPLGFYFELYNVQADQQSLSASLSLRLDVTRNGEKISTPFQGKDLARLIHRFSDRFFVGSVLDTRSLSPGTYCLTISVADDVAQARAVQAVPFTILAKEP